MFTDVVILAGGSGERLWPVSNAQKPKQFMALSDGVSFLQSALIRSLELGIKGDICVVTRQDWIPLVLEDVSRLSERIGRKDLLNKVLVMGEPFGKNTAPAIAWTSIYQLSLERKETVNVLLMASDHIISPTEAFTRDAETASRLSLERNLVSFAIPPREASTGYGYIKAGSPLPASSQGDSQGASQGDSPAFKIAAFKEKPDAATARSYISEGGYYWNSGIYGFRADFYLSELSLHCPQVTEAFKGAGASVSIEERGGIRVMTSWEGLEAAYAASPSISIDYAISEKCETSVSVEASFSWDDVGTWDSLSAYFPDQAPNASYIESRDCFVHSDIPVALCGVEDLIVVIRDGRALVSKKGHSNLVKNALGDFKNRGIE